MAGSIEFDASQFTAGLTKVFGDIKAGSRDEEERLAQLVVDSASPPVDTGELDASKFTRRTESGVEFGWAASYAAYVEYGTEHAEAQSFARPAEQQAAGQLKSPI